MDQPSWINRTLNDRYTIEALLGQGGMSAVYKASDPNLKRVVAIKLIHPHLATDSQFIARFEEEAAAVAKLRHPNIVQVFDFNADGGVYYMVLEFIPGETLQDRLARLNTTDRQMSIEEAVKFSINICDAIGYAHKLGIIHRDIKPANIMLDVYGQAILMDFGIVKIIGGDSHTATGAVLGTARYMAPEMIRAEVPDQRSDIYSLGITLYEMLSGQPPFNSDSAMSLMMMHLNDPVPDIQSIRADLPPALVSVLNKALEKDPGRRFGSASEMAAALAGVLSGPERESTSVAPAAPETPSARPQQAETEVVAAEILPDEQKTTAGQSRPDEGTAVPESAARTSVPDHPAEPVRTQVEPQSLRRGVTIDADSDQVRPQSRTAAGPNRPFPLLWAGIAGVVVVIAAIIGIISFGGRDTVDPTSQAAVSDTLPVALDEPTETPTPTPPVPTDTPTMTPTLTMTPTTTPTPTNTLPPLYVQINGITVNASNQYVVEYETFGYTETLPGMHVHFFFDTVPPEQAGLPGSGPWILYGGPRPFTGYSVSERPAQASQMCALVAYADHSIILESGNCFDLP